MKIFKAPEALVENCEKSKQKFSRKSEFEIFEF